MPCVNNHAGHFRYFRSLPGTIRFRIVFFVIVSANASGGYLSCFVKKDTKETT